MNWNKENLVDWVKEDLKVKIFYILTLLAVVSCLLLFKFKDCKLIENIGYGFIAAYIFYFINEFIPYLVNKYDEEKNNRLMMAITYRKLQLLLDRIDSMFLKIYKIKNERNYLGSVHNFYNEEFFKDFVCDFDLNQESDCLDFRRDKLTYKEYFISNWQDIELYSKRLLSTNYMRFDADLAYEIEYLLSHNYIGVFCKFLHNIENPNLKNIFPVEYFSEKTTPKNSLDNIINLHLIAFKMYDSLKYDKRIKFLNKPEFYK